MRSSPEPILHLVHPRPIAWRMLIVPIAKELGVPLVPYSNWLAVLEKTAEQGPDAAQDNPALRLLDFFRASARGDGKPPLGLWRLATDKALGASETLANMPALGEEDARRWVAAWRQSGFLGTLPN